MTLEDEKLNLVEAWKVFVLTHDGLMTPIFSQKFSLEDTGKMLYPREFSVGNNKLGFHAFINREDAEKYKNWVRQFFASPLSIEPTLKFLIARIKLIPIATGTQEYYISLKSVHASVTKLVKLQGIRGLSMIIEELYQYGDLES